MRQGKRVWGKPHIWKEQGKWWIDVYLGYAQIYLVDNKWYLWDGTSI